MSEIDRLIGIAKQVNVPFDPTTMAAKIALLLKGETAGDALDSLCYVTAMLIKSVPPDAQEHAFIHMQHLIRHIVLTDLDEEDE